MCEFCGNDNCEGPELPPSLADLGPEEIVRMLALGVAEIIGGNYTPKASYRTTRADGTKLLHGKTRDEFNRGMDLFLCRYIDGRDAFRAGDLQKAAELADALSADILAFFSDDSGEAMFALSILERNSREVYTARRMLESGGYSDDNPLEL